MPAGNTDLLAHIVAAFVRRRVRFIAIGGWAAQSQGYDLGYETEDIDFALQRERGNLDLVSSALTELGARVWTQHDRSFAFGHDGQSLMDKDVLELGL